MKKDYQEKWKERTPAKSSILQIYEYKDEKGELLFECVRFTPKAFRQRRPDGAGEYIWNLKGIRRVLYQLPELIKGEDPTFIVEGEKDVDNLREWGLTATCCPMGAEKWKSQAKEYNPFFKGRSVVIIPDNDEEGERHLDQVASSLQGTARNINVLRLPGANDFSEWRDKDKDNTEEKFLILASEAPEFKKKGLLQKAPLTSNIPEKIEEKPERIFITGRQLVKEKVKELPAPVKKGLFVPQRYTILAASDGEGKTLFCSQLSLSAITGTTFLDCFPVPKPVKVLYFCGENSRGDMQTKVKRQQEEMEKLLGRSIEKELEENFVLVEPININFFLNPKDKIELHAWLEDHKPDIVIFDPLADFISSQKSLSDDTLARGTVKTLTEIAQKYNCFPLLTTHLRKEAINPQTGRSIVTPENVWTFVFGSRFWLASAAAQIVIIRANLQRYPKAKKFCFKFKTAEQIEPVQVLRNPNLFYEELPSDKMSLASLTAQDVVEILERKCKGQQVETVLIDVVAKELDCSKTIARDLVGTAIKTNLLYKDKKDNLIKLPLKLEKGLKI